MTRDELIEALRREEPLFRAEKVRHVSLFGSQARGDARPDSDVDLLIDYEPGAPITLVDYCRLKLDLCDRLKMEINLMREPLRPTPIRLRIEGDLVAVL